MKLAACAPATSSQLAPPSVERCHCSAGAGVPLNAATKVALAPGAGPDGEARVWIGRDYLAGMEIERVVPEPSSVEAAADGQVFVFRTAAPGEAARVRRNCDSHTRRIGPRRPTI